jgi:hypothetical protein
MFGYYKYTTGLSFDEERIGPLAAIVTTIFYLLALYLLVLPITPENLFASIYSESLIKTTHQHLLLLVGFDTLIYRKYYDTPPILVGHQLAWAEYCYNTSYQSSLKETPFKVVYGRDPPSLHSYEPGYAKVAAVDSLLQEHDEFLANIRERLLQAQQYYKK